MTNCEQEECLNILIRDLKMLTKDGASPVLTIDKKCIQLSMKLLTVYKIVSKQNYFILKIKSKIYVINMCVSPCHRELF